MSTNPLDTYVLRGRSCEDLDREFWVNHRKLKTELNYFARDAMIELVRTSEKARKEGAPDWAVDQIRVWLRADPSGKQEIVRFLPHREQDD